MLVRKRDNSNEPVSRAKIVRRLSKLLFGLDSAHIDPDIVSQKVIEGLFEGVNTEQIDGLTAEVCASMTTIHPDYSILAARVASSALHKATKPSFTETMTDLHFIYDSVTKKHQPMITKEALDVITKNSTQLDQTIVHERDFDLNFFGFKTLERSYLLRIDGRVKERPQHLFMRVAIGIHGDDIESAIMTYNMMSLKYFTHGSPTLFNASTIRPQLASCFLVAMSDDSIDGIFDTLKECAMISKTAGGIGLHIHNIRSSGSYIAGTNGTSNGIIPMLRVFNNAARYVDQGGNKRPGAIAVYLEPWHADIFEFIGIRKNHGKEELRARDLFPALWIPDLFMERVQKNEDWSLFSPSDAPGLSDAYGEKFKELYTRYEKDGRARIKVRAQKLWYSILEAQTETGTPFMLYKDACNAKSNQKNLGTIKSSNLCCEIVEYSEPGETAVCNLASIALPTFVDTSTDDVVTYNFKKLHAVTKVVTKNLNRVIDRSYYPVESAKNSNITNRPIAIGVQGLADTFAMLRLPFDSEEAKMLNKQIFETIYHAAVQESMSLAKTEGPYKSFKGSPASEGLLQFDLWGVTPTSLWKWERLKQDVMTYGLRNSLLVAPMPTASTSQILGFNECFEPFTSNIYSRRVLSGEFQVVNPYLAKDLVDLGLWNDKLKNYIIANNGSIQALPDIPKEIKDLYKTVWEIAQKTIVDMAADRAPFIDQSQSLNIHIKNPTMAKLTSMHFHGWRRGLKTGMYYLRTQAASAAIQFTVDKDDLNQEFSYLGSIKSLKRPVYRPAKISRSTPPLSNDSESDLDQSFEDDGLKIDIHNTDLIACKINNPESCDMCSG